MDATMAAVAESTNEVVPKEEGSQSRRCGYRRQGRLIEGSLASGKGGGGFTGEDGHVQVGKIKVGKNALTRPVPQLCPLTGKLVGFQKMGCSVSFEVLQRIKGPIVTFLHKGEFIKD
ncbi:hypothetical protein HOLleu_11562 [Holothuria leucospilota]|uniref:Uncharacterized protein n=1 Tax=Holothuria leucospilota TaxID=206669 RepID=A0A9Q1CF35_HOLLE|nr:hypothetical protein HOLleu_11562 [Holothuria leucospilota]